MLSDGTVYVSRGSIVRGREIKRCMEQGRTWSKDKDMRIGSSSGVVVMLANLAELLAFGSHLGEETTPRPRPLPCHSRLWSRGCRCLGLDVRLYLTNTVADNDRRSELVEVSLQLFIQAALQHPHQSQSLTAP